MEACDVCGGRIEKPEGFLLTTKVVVTSKHYWTKYLRVLSVRIPESQFAAILPNKVADLASSDTPWMVCDACSRLFSFNRTERRDKARVWRVTGQPARGFALCKVTQRGKDIIVETIDDEGYCSALRAAFEALREFSEDKGISP
ncbi:hypothetical protein KJ693_02925 [bacterium]|nr:hypothetical protein [bacterium]MBU1614244.1 hypothetical protein [bacterium]